MKVTKSSKFKTEHKKTHVKSHKELVREITEANRAYIAKINAKQPQPAISKKYPDEILRQKLKDAETVRQILDSQNHQSEDTLPITSAPQPVIFQKRLRSPHSNLLPLRPDFSESPWLKPLKWTAKEKAALPNMFPEARTTTPPDGIKIIWKQLCGEQKTWPVIFILVMVIWIVAQFGYLGVYLFKHPLVSESSSDNLKFDAYYTAKQFIQTQYPGAKSFSDFDHSHVDNKGNGIWWVTVSVDGVNAFNTAIQNTMLVEMKTQNANWYLVEIVNRP